MAAKSTSGRSGSGKASRRRILTQSRTMTEPGARGSQDDVLTYAGEASLVQMVAALDKAPPNVRSSVMTSLQRSRGNAYVQRVVSEVRSCRRSDSSKPRSAQFDTSGASAAPRADLNRPGQRGVAPAFDSTATVADAGTISLLARRESQRPTVIARDTTAVAGETTEKAKADTSGPLTPAQVEHARNWYAAHQHDYTPDIIKQIQQAVGADPDGLIGPMTIQAVARYQQANSPLAADGIAGPRTLPALFPTGLAESAKSGEYVKKAKEVQSDWATLKTADERGKALANAVNKELVASGVPACNYVLADLGDDAGQFDFATWTLSLGQKPFSKATITDEEAADMANTVYHEARHSQQWFMMAQMRAGQGRSAKQIATELGIPATIASAAVDKPLKHGSMEALEAKGWYESVYGAQSTHRENVLTGLDKKGKQLHDAQDEYKKNPTKENKAKLKKVRAEYDELYREYRDLPEEADAWRVGDQVTNSYLAGAKK